LNRPINYLSSPQFGQSTQMLGASLGTGGQSGGLNPLYQIGVGATVAEDRVLTDRSLAVAATH
jgi:hypothetical protein